jgi:flagellar motor switch protein FliG
MSSSALMECVVATSDIRKAAVFVASLPKPQADALLARLSAIESAALQQEIDAVGPVALEEQLAVLREVADAERGRTAVPQQQSQPQPAALGKTLRFDRPHPVHVESEDSPFAFLHAFTPEELLVLLGEEQPQTLAVVFVHLPADLAGDVLEKMPAERQTAVIARIAAMNSPDPTVVQSVADAVYHRAFGDVEPRTPHSLPTGVHSVVRMLNVMTPSIERRLLDAIAASDPDLHRAIRLAMFGADVAACGEWNVSDAA